jgi:hypothetical protein
VMRCLIQVEILKLLHEKLRDYTRGVTLEARIAD